MSETAFDLSCEYDEKRQGYRIQGSGFEFFAYFTGDDSREFIECDHVQRNGQGFVLHLKLRLGANGKVHRDIFETALDRELSKYWDR